MSFFSSFFWDLFSTFQQSSLYFVLSSTLNILLVEKAQYEKIYHSSRSRWRLLIPLENAELDISQYLSQDPLTSVNHIIFHQQMAFAQWFKSKAGIWTIRSFCKTSLPKLFLKQCSHSVPEAEIIQVKCSVRVYLHSPNHKSDSFNAFSNKVHHCDLAQMFVAAAVEVAMDNLNWWMMSPRSVALTDT